MLAPVPHSFGIDNDNGLDMDSSSVIGNRALYVPPTGNPLGMPSARLLPSRLRDCRMEC